MKAVNLEKRLKAEAAHLGQRGTPTASRTMCHTKTTLRAENVVYRTPLRWHAGAVTR